MTKINWENYGVYNGRFPDDWQHVLTVDDGGGYEWATLHAFYAPKQRRYFWGSGSGCSCSSWGQGFAVEGDFQSGTKRDLERSIRSFLDENPWRFTSAEGLDAIAELRRWKPKAVDHD